MRTSILVYVIIFKLLRGGILLVFVGSLGSKNSALMEAVYPSLRFLFYWL